MKTKELMTVVAVIALAGVGQMRLKAADEDDKPIKLSDTPASVQAAVAKAAEGGKLKSLTKEDEDGTMQYSAVIKKDGKTLEAAISLAGLYLGVEEDIQLSDAPQAVQDALGTAAEGGKVSGVEMDTAADGTVSYEADITKGGSKSEVDVSASGTVTKTEQEGKEGADKD